MKKDLKTLYICRGENDVEPFKMGYCGDVKTLDEWLDCLFGEKKSWFNGYDYSPKEILDYIYKNYGKRLEPIK